MSKHVFLQRHTEAQSSNNRDDFQRDLSKFGINQAKAVADFLNTLSIKPEKILCSPAYRTKHTLEIIKDVVDFSFEVEFIESIYNASTEDIEELIISQSDNIESIMIIGHNPNITSINMSFLLDQSTKIFREALDYSIPGKLTIIDIESPKWQDVFKHQAFILNSFFPLIDTIQQ